MCRLCRAGLMCYLCGMAKTVRVYARVLPEIYRGLEEMAKRGGYRSVPNFVTTLLNRMAIEAAGRDAADISGGFRGATPPLYEIGVMFGRDADAMPPDDEGDMLHDEIAEMFGEYTDAEAPRYGERTKRTRRTECW